MGLRIGICAGEHSGDALGAGLMDALRARRPDCEFVGVAGPQMLARGCTGLMPMERLSVVGLVEGAARLVELLPQRGRLARELVARGCGAFVGVDAPDFNLGLERRLRRAGLPTIHYVSPSVWAWRSYRTRTLARAADRVLTLFPFERGFLAARGVCAEFVGHPLADEIDGDPDPAAARRALGIGTGAPVLTLLPGSRIGEIERHAAPMLGAGEWLAARVRGLEIVAAPTVGDPGDRFAAIAARARIPVRTAAGRAREAMAAANVVLVASGTAALEVMLVRRPMVVIYRTHPLTWAIGRRMLHVDTVSLPNLLAGRRLVPELLQRDAEPNRIGAALLRLFEDRAHAERLRSAFAAVHRELRRDASERAAEAVLAVAGGAGGKLAAPGSGKH